MSNQKNKKSLIILLIVFIILTISLCGYIVYDKVFLGDKKEQNNIQNSDSDKNSENIPTSDLTTMFLESTEDRVKILYAFVDNGILYYFNDEKDADGVEEGAFDFISSFYSNDDYDLIKYSKINNIKRIKLINRGTGVSPELFLITNDGKVYSTREIFDKELSFTLSQEFKDYQIENIIDKEGEMFETFEVLLKDGSKLKIDVNK